MANLRYVENCSDIIPPESNAQQIHAENIEKKQRLEAHMEHIEHRGIETKSIGVMIGVHTAPIGRKEGG